MSLDDIKTYGKYDKEEISYGIEHLPEQVKIAWEGTQKLNIPDRYKDFDHVVIVGMGGSALGPHIIRSVFADSAKIKVSVVREYNLPAWVTKKSLVILSSFSGTTEEVLSIAKEGRKRGLKMAVISAGGKLIALARREKYPYYQITPGELAKQPRLGVGFSVVGLLGILNAMGIVRVKEKHIKQLIEAMVQVVDTCSLEVKSVENPAKIVAEECLDRPVMLIAAEHLAGNVHTFQNQINETAKQLCTFDLISELNHHRMEGLAKPDGVFENYTVIMLRSELYSSRIQKRFDITANVFEKLGGRVIDYNCGGGSKLEEAGEVLQFGSFVSYYLGMLNKVNPETNAYVDWFKRQLK